MGGEGGGQFCQNCFCLPSEKWPAVTEKKGCKLFPSRLDPFSEGTLCPGKQRRSHKKLSPL